MPRLRTSPMAQAAWMLLVATALGTAAQWLSPTRIPWREAWSARAQTKATEAGIAIADTARTRALIDSGGILVFDARSASDYDAGHLPGALSFPDSQRIEKYPDYAGFLTPDQQTLIYCSGQTCDESLELCLFLKEQGHTNLVLYLGGYQDWTAAQLPISK
ncbi:MAG: hypothetical protein J5I99_10160 [Verrucomicrobia bacterium]|nr:hypothetical protein [Verrucomicrobiota bacterium]